jgi:hypothetical protein
MARCDQATTAVSARARQHDHADGRETGYGELGEVSPGVLHHLDQLDVKVLGHSAVDLPHLVGRQGWALGLRNDRRLDAGQVSLELV